MTILENIRQAFRSIKANRLRTFLTIAIIAFGITALVGILTAMEAITGSINANFTRMGANSFNITEIREGRSGAVLDEGPFRLITYRQALEFKERYEFPSTVSVSTLGTPMATVKYDSEETNPNVFVYGVDDTYIDVAGHELERGRNFSDFELQSGHNVIILGLDVYKRLFKPGQNPIDEYVSIGNLRYKVIGVLEGKGSSMMGAGDNIALATLPNVRSRFANPRGRFVITVAVSHPEYLEPAIGEATGTFRNIRRLRLTQPDDFTTIRSDSLVNSLIENLSMIAVMAGIIGLITLIGAAVALMNILLVSVTERTSEIGITKALGAKKRNIRTQFLVEALVICQLGGIMGVIFGIVMGNLVSVLLKSPFVIPWVWMGLGIALCFVTGITAGLYPAIKASNLDPIEALRYE